MSCRGVKYGLSQQFGIIGGNPQGGSEDPRLVATTWMIEVQTVITMFLDIDDGLIYIGKE